MKLILGLLTALASCAAAAQPVADVFILPSTDASSMTTTTTPSSLPRSLARLILLQRLTPIGRGPSTKNLPNGIEADKIVSALNQFGKTTPPLFTDDNQPEEARQLVLMLEGMTEKQIKDTQTSLKMQPSFRISNPPSAGAHDKLARYDFYNAGIAHEHKCGLDRITNPFAEECWRGKSAFARYNVKKSPEALKLLLDRFSKLKNLAKNGEMETTILLLPVVSESSSSSNWPDRPQELRRRQDDGTEQVMSSNDRPVSHAMPTAKLFNDDNNNNNDDDDSDVPLSSSGPIPACFNSLEACVSATANCSQQGECLDQFASESGGENSQVCFACQCLSTRTREDGPLTHWAGPTCAKQDISVPFWLFAGFTLLMIGILSLAVTTLYAIGEEKLPGVIGAGVSKSK